MKKTVKIILGIVVLVLVSCTSPIDKKIILTEYNDVIQKIKEEHPEYSEEVYTRANNKTNALLFRTLSNGGMKTDKTYREFLNEAKAEIEKEESELAVYNEGLNKIRSVFTAKVADAEYFDEYSPILREQYRAFIAEIDYTNLSDKDINGVEGKILVKNEKGEVLMTCYIKFADANLFPAGKTRKNVNEFAVIEGVDNIMELSAIPIDKFVYEWMPELIIFSDGSRMEAPQKPAFLYKDK